MSDSLRDQLLGLGFKPVPKAEKPAKPQHRPNDGKAGAGKPGSGHSAAGHPGKPHASKPHPGRQDRGQRPGQGGNAVQTQGRPATQTATKPARSREEMDLAKAYAIRAQREKEERIEAERLKQEEARLRREAKAKLAGMVKGKGLNDPDAEIARHFNYGNKIKRIFVNEAQLKALNAGELGVLQLDGRYLLVTAELLSEAEAIFPPSVALKVDPNAPAEDDPYADPQYQVPDDLVW